MLTPLRKGMEAVETAYHGSVEWELQPGGELVTDNKGLVTGRMLFKGLPGAWPTMPQIGSEHPFASFCAMERRSVRFAAGFWEVTGEYAGTQNTGTGDESSSDSSSDSSDSGSDSSSGDDNSWEYDLPPVYELTPGTGTEPIETHPRFAEFAGTPSAPLNGAIFRDANGNQTSVDDAGVFDRFLMTSAWAGCEAYLTPSGTVWSKSWVASAEPSSAGVGITDSPPGSPPNFGGSYNWLTMPPSYSRRGRAYDCRQIWLLSGARGWNAELYA
jgi:hypothetical protein